MFTPCPQRDIGCQDLSVLQVRVRKTTRRPWQDSACRARLIEPTIEDLRTGALVTANVLAI